MYIPKRYGEAKIDKCPFCGAQAFSRNAEGVPVCRTHKQEALAEFKCACGSYLERRQGKWGVYFNCMKCGNMNMRKAMELNPTRAVQKNKTAPRENTSDVGRERVEMTVRSDDPRFF